MRCQSDERLNPLLAQTRSFENPLDALSFADDVPMIGQLLDRDRIHLMLAIDAGVVWLQPVQFPWQTCHIRWLHKNVVGTLSSSGANVAVRLRSRFGVRTS